MAAQKLNVPAADLTTADGIERRKAGGTGIKFAGYLIPRANGKLRKFYDRLLSELSGGFGPSFGPINEAGKCGEGPGSDAAPALVRAHLQSMITSVRPCGLVALAPTMPHRQARPPTHAYNDHQSPRARRCLGNPCSLMLTPGQDHDLTCAQPLLENADPGAFIGDKAYDADSLIDTLNQRAITPVIPPKANRKVKRDCDFALYRERNLVERFFNKIKHYRAIATRYDKLARNFLAAVHLVAAIILLN
jgi:transposase